jgi:hypothetical protein
MSLFMALANLVAAPIGIVVDIIELPGKCVDGDNDLLKNTKKCLAKVEDELE